MKNKLFQMIGKKYETDETFERMMDGLSREELKEEVQAYAEEVAGDLGISGMICVSLPCLTCDDQSVEFDVFVVTCTDGVLSREACHYQTEF